MAAIPDISTKKGAAFLGASFGTGLMVVLVNSLKQFYPEHPLTDFLTGETLAVLTGGVTYLSTILLLIIAQWGQDYTFKMKHKRLLKLKDQFPDHPEIDEQIKVLLKSHINSIR